MVRGRSLDRVLLREAVDLEVNNFQYGVTIVAWPAFESLEQCPLHGVRGCLKSLRLS
jgi:hypothetical protein